MKCVSPLPLAEVHWTCTLYKEWEGGGGGRGKKKVEMDQWTLHLCLSREFTFLNSLRFSFLLYDFVYLLLYLTFTGHISSSEIRISVRGEERRKFAFTLACISLSFVSLYSVKVSLHVHLKHAGKMTRRLETMPFTVSNWLTSLERRREKLPPLLCAFVNLYCVYRWRFVELFFLHGERDRKHLHLISLLLPLLSSPLCPSTIRATMATRSYEWNSRVKCMTQANTRCLHPFTPFNWLARGKWCELRNTNSTQVSPPLSTATSAAFTQSQCLFLFLCESLSSLSRSLHSPLVFACTLILSLSFFFTSSSKNEWERRKKIYSHKQQH